jgi:hypothetical protein
LHDVVYAQFPAPSSDTLQLTELLEHGVQSCHLAYKMLPLNARLVGLKSAPIILLPPDASVVHQPLNADPVFVGALNPLITVPVPAKVPPQFAVIPQPLSYFR